jgi:hypothetical protein
MLNYRMYIGTKSPLICIHHLEKTIDMSSYSHFFFDREKMLHFIDQMTSLHSSARMQSGITPRFFLQIERLDERANRCAMIFKLRLICLKDHEQKP